MGADGDRVAVGAGDLCFDIRMVSPDANGLLHGVARGTDVCAGHLYGGIGGALQHNTEGNGDNEGEDGAVIVRDLLCGNPLTSTVPE